MAKKKETQATEYPWEQQPGEGAKAFQAFNEYMLMGTERSHAKVANELGKSTTMISRWSSTWKWSERVAAWDAEQERLLRQEQLEAIKKMRKRHAIAAAKMVTLASLGMDGHLKEHKAAIALGKNYTLPLGEIARLMAEGTKIERLSRGDTSEVIEGRDGGPAIDPVQIYIPDNKRNDDDTFDDLKV